MKVGEVIANRYELVSKLGSGGFGAVWKATDRLAGNIEVAIKIYAHVTGLDDTALAQFQKEYTLVMDLHHPNLLTAKHFDIWENRPFLIFPLMTGGSLYQKILNSEGLSEDEIAQVLYQVADGLSYLHENDVIHQDVKPDNVLIDSKGRYLLTDFGISSRMRSTLRRATGVQNSKTISFAPPERFGSNQQIVPEGDIFSLGVMIYEMATTSLPWMGMGGMHLMPHSELPTLPDRYSAGLNTLMNAMLNYYPSKRPTAQQIKAAAARYLENGIWNVEDFLKISQPGSQQVHLGRSTSVFEPITSPMSQKSSGSSAQKTVISSQIAAEERSTHGDQKYQDIQTNHSKPKGRKAMMAAIAAVVVLVGGVIGWTKYSKAKESEQIETFKANANQLLAAKQFKNAYFYTDSLLALSNYSNLDELKSLRQQALDSMAENFNKSHVLFRLSYILQNKEEMKKHLEDLLKFTINQDTIEKYKKILADISTDTPENLTPPEQLFGNNRQKSESTTTATTLKPSTPAQSTSAPAVTTTSTGSSTKVPSQSSASAISSDINTFFDDKGATITALKVDRLYWMVTRSNPTVLRNSSPIRQIIDHEEWNSTLAPAYFLHNGTYLYNGIATNGGKICPEGWRLPTQSDWENLIKSLTSSPNVLLDHRKFGLKTVGYRSADGMMKEVGYAFFWVADNAAPNAAGKYAIYLSVSNGKIYYDYERLMGDWGHTGLQCRCVKEI
ncbi:MAG: protein kinase domain-containing protein [Thermaurantimonas sp.]|uniref:protein kinase domain-containing protein n=1 Tax=Thermaurantimonas sp. TaxID=2681568 RepID=UPI00391AD39F